MVIFLLLGLAFPRFVIFLLWLLTDWFVRVSVDAIVGILGFLLMPYTLLWYSAVANFYSGAWGFWQMLIMVIAILIDLSQLFASGRYYYSE